MENHKKPVTLKTLAVELGLTPATISKALRDSSDISEKTRLLVKKTAKRLGYQPNLLARSLIRRRSNILGVLVPDLGHSFFAEVSRGMYERARQLGYETIIMVHDENARIERRNLRFLSALNVDGILIASVPGAENVELISNIYDRGIPFVCFDRVIESLNFSAITIDDEKAASEIMDHIIRANRGDIVFIGPTTDLFVAKGRFEGYKNALNRAGIKFRQEFVLQCKSNADAEQVMKKFIKTGRKFDAVLCVSGLIAYGVGCATLKAGLSIPDQVMLAEFGDNNIVHRLGVPFMTVDQMPYEMGQKALEMIVDIIDTGKQPQPPQHVFIETRILTHHFNSKSAMPTATFESQSIFNA